MADQAGSLVYDISADDSKLQSSLASADKSVQDFGKSMSTTGENIKSGLNKVAVTTGVVGAGLTLIAKNATDFTVNFARESKSLGRELGVTTEEASRLTAGLGRMGISSDQAQASFGIFAKKISASTEQSTANRLATEKLNIEIDKTTKSIADTSKEIQLHGDKSGALNLKLKELNNTLATQKDALNKGADGFAKMGISTVDATGKQKDFKTILNETADKFKGMPDGIDKTALSMELFGRQGKDMIKVLNLGSSGIADLEKQADKLGLTLNSKSIASISKLVESQKDLKQSTDAMKISIGLATAPVLTQFNEHLNNMVTSLLNADGPIHGITVGVLAFGGPILGAVSGIASFASAMVDVVPVMIKMGKALKSTAVAQWLLNIAMDANPVGLIIGGIALLITAIVLMATHMDTTRKKFEEVTAFFRTGWGSAILGAIAVLNPLIGLPLVIATYWRPISQFFKDLWQDISNIFTEHWTLIKNIVAYASFGVFGLLIANFGAIKNFVASVWAEISRDTVQTWWNLQNSVNNALNGLYNIANNVFHGIVGIFNWVGASISGIAGWINGTFWNMVGNIAGAINNAVAWVSGLPSRLAGAVGNLGGVLWGAGRSLMDGLMGGIMSGWDNIKNSVSGMARWIKDHKGPIETDRKLLVPAGNAIMQGLHKGLKNEWANVQDFVSSIGGDLNGNILMPAFNGDARGVGTSKTTTNNASTVVNIGQVNNAQDEAYVIRRLDRNGALEGVGISPVQ